MKSVLGLLLLLFAAPSYGLESFCDATQDASVCYGALGGPVMLQLMMDTRGYFLRLWNEEEPIFSNSRRGVMTTSLFPEGRWQVVAGNGNLIINPAERSDSGTYTVKIQKETGDMWEAVAEHTVQLLVEAPVSHLDLSLSCSAYGERRARCSSNGDSPQFSWSLDGRALSEVYPDASSQTDSTSAVLTLPEVIRGHQGSSEVIRGHLTCSAFNNVSSINTTQPLPSCTTTLSPMTMPTTTLATTLENSPATTLATNPVTTLATTHQSGPSDEASLWIFLSVWLAEIIVLASLHLGSCYLHMRRKRAHTALQDPKATSCNKPRAP